LAVADKSNDSIEILYAQRDVYKGYWKDSTVIRFNHVTNIIGYELYLSNGGGSTMDGGANFKQPKDGEAGAVVSTTASVYKDTTPKDYHFKVFYGDVQIKDSLVAKPYIITKIVIH
jgi:hypothetical protein